MSHRIINVNVNVNVCSVCVLVYVKFTLTTNTALHVNVCSLESVFRFQTTPLCCVKWACTRCPI